MSDAILKVGVPSKGRLSELAGELLSQAGIKYRRQNRGLFAKASGLPVDVVFLRTDDIPTMCAVGAIDMGITGSDLVDESALAFEQHEAVVNRMKLGVGRCRLAVCVPQQSDFKSAADLDGSVLATSFPKITEEYLRRHDAAAQDIVSLAGSVEIMIGLGVAHAIVDLVETGSTLAANQLRILDEIGTYETVLIQSPKVQPNSEIASIADRMVRRLEGVVLARDYSRVEYNVPRDRLAEAERITPGFNSPTVNSLEDPKYCAVTVLVPRGDVIDVMERLENLGASAIFETAITNCRL